MTARNHSERLECPECAREVHAEAICQHGRAVCIGCCVWVCFEQEVADWCGRGWVA